MGRAWLYDGRNAVRRSVELSAAGDMLRLTEADGQSLEVPPQLLFHAQSRAGAETYGRSDLNGWRLTIEGPAMWEVERLLPSKKVYGGLIDRIGLPRAVVIGAAVSAALLFVFYSAPTWLAPLVPERVEKRMGDALVGDFGGKFCRGTGGQAALDKL
ncbi:MAG TPA: hypothetical protein VNT25_02490, partial [Allosphingosinicella sp.]|nr:hypothetical protein [Allosphingosinicella sp.]